ncbi:hypothetical protein NM688_g7578 [Phlebia brevispora]|uniref:Uncharacterized protein n=1 Tax=Phlebia brevispora TaxID=194682 RepID=A0ACC1S3S3_9APHY|nr:hypothetical protein NM688_g7578 [Phlebia brevispora]
MYSAPPLDPAAHTELSLGLRPSIPSSSILSAYFCPLLPSLMPQIYRRHSEYAPGSLTESRLRTTIASTPQLTDADDSIVLSDLVRTGEASRLRRRGAMRLEHGAPRPLLTGSPPAPTTSSRFGPPPTRPVIVPPSRPTSPPVGAILLAWCPGRRRRQRTLLILTQRELEAGVVGARGAFK